MHTHTLRERLDSNSEISPADARSMLAAGQCVLVDVREPDEHARERIHGAKLMPLATVTAASIAGLGSNCVLLHCKSGRRSADAVTRCASLSTSDIVVASVRGGIEAWRAAGLPTIVDAARPKRGVMQQTQIVIGLGVVTGTALGYFVHPGFLALAAFFGAGLTVAGVTGFCGLAAVLAKMPWNRQAGCAVPASARA